MSQNESVDSRLENLSRRLDGVEAALGLRSQSTLRPPAPAAGPAPLPAIKVTLAQPQVRGERVRTQASLSQVLAVVAVICFVLAATFMAKLAIAEGWVTPERQWGGMILLGAAFVALGRFINAIDSGYRSYLSAAGIIFLYFAAYTGALHFDFLSDVGAALAAMAVSVLALGMFRYHENEIFSVTAAVGTYAAPLLLGRTAVDPMLVSAFFLVWTATFSAVSSLLQTRVLVLVSSYLAFGVFAAINNDVRDEAELLRVIGVQVLQFVIIVWGVVNYSVRNRTPMTPTEGWAYFPVLAFFYATTYMFLNRFSPGVAPWMALTFAAILIAGYQSAKKRLQRLDSLASSEMVKAFAGIVVVHAGYLELLPAGAKSWILAVFVLYAYLSEQRKAFPRLSGILLAGGIALSGIEYARIVWTCLKDHTPYSLVMAFVTTGMLLFYYRSVMVPKRGDSPTTDRGAGGVLLGMTHLLAVVGLYSLVEDYGSVAVSTAWGLYAVGILMWSFQSRDEQVARSSLIVLLIATTKALVYDAAQAPALVRVICLLGTGALLYGTGIAFKKVSGWGRK